MKTVTLKSFLIAVDHQIQEGSPFGWVCYGSNARWLDCGNFQGFGTNPYWMASVVFDTKTLTVYEVRLHDCDDPENPKSWRWVNPKFEQASKDEHASRGYRYKEASECNDFIDYKEPDKILKKITKVVTKHNLRHHRAIAKAFAKVA